MARTGFIDGAGEKSGRPDGATEFRRQDTSIKTGALQNAIFNRPNFSSVGFDAKGVIQIFNVGAKRMPGQGVQSA